MRFNKTLLAVLVTLVSLSFSAFAQEVRPVKIVTPKGVSMEVNATVAESTAELIWYGSTVHTFPSIKRNGVPLELRVYEPATMQVPTRLFDVRNGNGLVENGTTYNRATYIAFKDNASKDAIIDAVCAMGGYQATIPNPAYDPNVEGSQPTIPNPQTKQAFFNKRIEQFLRDNYKAWKISTAEKAAKATAESAADAELPIQ